MKFSPEVDTAYMDRIRQRVNVCPDPADHNRTLSFLNGHAAGQSYVYRQLHQLRDTGLVTVALMAWLGVPDEADMPTGDKLAVCPDPADHKLAAAVRKATYWRCPRHEDRMTPEMGCSICVDVVLRVYRAALEADR